MKNIEPGLFAALTVACLVLASGAHADTSKKRTKPPPPVQTDLELGFFDNTRADVLASIKRIGILPADIPERYRKHQDETRLALTDAATKYLKLAGFDVVGPDTYQAAYDRFNKQLGGIYDTKTGELRRQQAAAVLENAKREFVSKEHLDGYVALRLMPRQARYFASKVIWDGVIDRSDGKPPRNGFVDFLTGNDTTGALPALSLLVQIVNAQDRVVFGRMGGIQTLAYIDVVNAQLAFLDVSVDDVLKDATRFDRAARAATLPLVHTPQEISLGDDDPQINTTKIDPDTLAPLPPGLPLKRESPFLVAREQILQKVHRVALSGLSLESFKVPDEVQARLVADIKKELAPLNWEVIDAPQARDMLLLKIVQADMFDPYSGERDQAKASAIRKSVFSSLGITPTPDAILWVGVTRTMAIHRMGDVEWDGVSQSGITLGPVVEKFFSGSALPYAGSGGVAAVSLTTYLADANDTGLYRSRGGLQLVQKLNYTPPVGRQVARTEPVDLAPSELFKDESREQPAAHAALRDLVLTPQALYLELNPLKPGERRMVVKKKKKR